MRKEQTRALSIIEHGTRINLYMLALSQWKTGVGDGGREREVKERKDAGGRERGGIGAIVLSFPRSIKQSQSVSQSVSSSNSERRDARTSERASDGIRMPRPACLRARSVTSRACAALDNCGRPGSRTRYRTSPRAPGSSNGQKFHIFPVQTVVEKIGRCMMHCYVYGMILYVLTPFHNRPLSCVVCTKNSHLHGL